MKDLRLIEIINKEVSISDVDIYKPMTEIEYAIQRLVLCLLNTQGTMVDNTSWGSNIDRVYMKTRKPNLQETEKDMSLVITDCLSSLKDSEPDIDYKIIDLSFVSLSRNERGISVTLNVVFQNASKTQITIPGDLNVIS